MRGYSWTQYMSKDELVRLSDELDVRTIDFCTGQLAGQS